MKGALKKVGGFERRKGNKNKHKVIKRRERNLDGETKMK